MVLMIVSRDGGAAFSTAGVRVFSSVKRAVTRLLNANRLSGT
jgi:hypothetical protein